MAPKKEKENLKKEVAMTEHKEDLKDMEKRLGTNFESVSILAPTCRSDTLVSLRHSSDFRRGATQVVPV